MVKIMENPINMGWFGGTPIFGNIHLLGSFKHVSGNTLHLRLWIWSFLGDNNWDTSTKTLEGM